MFFLLRKIAMGYLSHLRKLAHGMTTMVVVCVLCSVSMSITIIISFHFASVCIALIMHMIPHDINKTLPGVVPQRILITDIIRSNTANDRKKLFSSYLLWFTHFPPF